MTFSRQSPISGNLEKAKLVALNGEAKDIEFMFNPTELAFEGVVETADNPGASSESSGKPKISFSNIKAYRITINNILYDVYENSDSQRSVIPYIETFKQATTFVQGKQRPPIYRFMWGSQTHLQYCFIEKLNYKFTMFMRDGTPVRAVIDGLTLKETDNPDKLDSEIPPPQPSGGDTISSRSQGRNRPQ